MDDAKNISRLARKIAAEASYLESVSRHPHPQFEARTALLTLQGYAKELLDELNRMGVGR